MSSIGLIDAPVLVFATYAFFSVLTFVAYGADKAAARQGRWRTPETTLHLLSALGGWPGALLAQRIFRHKTRKRRFRVAFWATVVINCVMVAIVVLWAARRPV